jgi:hypothetical protein
MAPDRPKAARRRKASDAKEGNGPGPKYSASNDKKLANYSRVVDQAELFAIRLIEVSFSVSPLNFEAENKEPHDFYYGVSGDSIAFDSEAGVGGIFLSCEAGRRVGGVDLVACKAKYFVGYQGLTGCEDEAVNVFLARVGRFACYPYFRSLVSTLDWNAGTDLPTLPVLREPVIPKSRKKSVQPIIKGEKRPDE